ncbi:helix-turn-helix transcriptional regulator [Desulfonatronum thioautotrophicum]|uniref:helix-turn-helix transcriptional regulator n=1 Tax=Desulfonatronum thioautotrophicum TaxID=617001 RepID=UPI0005EBBCEC|nr:WYL domain-containing protein [Desulfonatronum thioautotrophicum]
MSELQQMERILWFDQQIRAERLPNARTMAEQFEISTKTAQRTINFIRDRLHAPLEYDPQQRGFYYREADFVLSVVRFNEEDILVLLLARKLLSSSIGGAVSMAVKGLEHSLAKALEGRCLTIQRIEEGFSALWHGHRPAQAQTFRLVSSALLETRSLCFAYHTAAMKKCVERTVQPHHLQHYMGSWLLIAWCELREGWRKFYLCRMDDVRILDTTFVPRPRQEWGHHVEGAFGIYQGKETCEVRLLFSPFMSRYIEEQVWHPEQITTPRPDGQLELSFPVADFREVFWKILQCGSHVRVLEPLELQEQVRDEIRLMNGIYGN